MKITDFTTFANGNGVPCNGDLIETEVDGVKYRAEFYVDDNFGHPVVCLAADSAIEAFKNGEWQAIVIDDDDELNKLISKITPELD